MSEHNALANLIRRGRMRQVRHLLVEEASFSTALALDGAILLLLLGTQILNWYWPVLLFVVSLGIGAYRARKKVLSPYQVAQSMDRRLDFHDSLSTAFYFQQHSERVLSPVEFVDHQRQSAEDLARNADLRRGVPFLAPRTFYVNLALALLVCAMFGLRFGINRNMDLRASLVPIPFDGFLGSSARQVADAKKAQRPFDGDGHRENGMPVDPWQSKQGDLDPAPDSALQTVDTPEVNNPDGGSDAKAQSKASGTEQQTPGQDPLESPDKGDQSQPGNDSQADQNSSPDGGQQSGKQQSPKNANQSPNSGENSSLSDKMRDALANLMAKLKMQPKNSDGKQGGSSQQNSQQQAQKQGQSQDPNASAQQQSDANAQSQGQQSQNAQQQASQGKSDGRSSDKSNSPEGKSGIGKQDGDKTAREAEQLAAMGKISEIIGKRTANVTGEVMVEVASGKQQLRTQYSQRKAAHGEAGGEINRDEVPLAYQQYVQQYFEEIRKLPASKAKSDAKTKTPGN
ncbi:MAG TPA: hypothetical protein VEU96_17410 [Bryobacteraceae bacterium]|nr:hypothetical protein [Bryobacteraceae bacterium]